MADTEKTEKQTILHMAYRYKDEATGQYVTAYFENDLRDVQIPNEIQDQFFGATNMLEFTNSLMNKLTTFAPSAVVKRSDEIDPSAVYRSEQLIYETDTRKAKIADGATTYRDLKYVTIHMDSDLTNYIDNTLIPASEKDNFFGSSTVHEFLNELMTTLKGLNPLTVIKRSYQYVPTDVYRNGQLLYESDSRKLKIADGVTQYQFLEYVASEYVAINDNEYTEITLGEAIIGKNIVLRIKNEDGSTYSIPIHDANLNVYVKNSDGEYVELIDTTLAEQILGGDTVLNISRNDGSILTMSVSDADLNVYIKDENGNYNKTTKVYALKIIRSIEYPISSNVEVIMEDSSTAVQYDGQTSNIDIKSIEVLNTAPTDGREWYIEEIA